MGGCEKHNFNKKSGSVQWLKGIFPTYEEYVRAYIKYHKGLFEETYCMMEDVLNNLDNNFVQESKKENALAGVRIWKKVEAQ